MLILVWIYMIIDWLRMYVSMHMCLCICAYVCVCVYELVCMYRCVCMYVGVYVFILVDTNVHNYQRKRPCISSFVEDADALLDLDASEQHQSKVVAKLLQTIDSHNEILFTMNRNGVLKEDDVGIKYFDLSNAFLAVGTSDKIVSEHNYYTHAYVLKWSEDAGDTKKYKTLLKPAEGSCTTLDDDSLRQLGMMLSNNADSFSTSQYGMDPQQSHWEVLVVTGVSTSSDSNDGTTTFYTMNESGSMTLRARVNKVCTGFYDSIGAAGQFPGKIARVMTWQRVLDTDEIQALAVELTGTT